MSLLSSGFAGLRTATSAGETLPVPFQGTAKLSADADTDAQQATKHALSAPPAKVSNRPPGRLLRGFFDTFVVDKKTWMDHDLYLLDVLGFDQQRSLEITRESYEASQPGEGRAHRHARANPRRLGPVGLD